MAITATADTGRDFKKVPAGCHFAICNMVVDLGIQKTMFQGEQKRVHQVYIRWEVPDERVTYERDGREFEGPCSIGSTYTLSLSDKANLRKVVENWTGKPLGANPSFDITQLAGTCCQIMVTHKQSGGKTYANVTGVMGISKDQKARAANAKSEVGVLVYDFDDESAYEKLPNWIKEKLESREAETPRGRDAPTKSLGTQTDDLNDDIPF